MVIPLVAGALLGKLAKKAGTAVLSKVKDKITGKTSQKTAKSAKSKTDGTRKRRKSVMYYLRRIPIEKAKARLTKIKMSAYKGI